MNYVLIFCNSTAGRLIYAHSHYNMCAGGGYMYQIKQLANGNVEFPIVKDTASDITTPRLYNIKSTPKLLISKIGACFHI